MPPVRRCPAAHRQAPYSRGRSLSSLGDLLSNNDDGSGGAVLGDALSAVFARLPDAADVMRCAATCRRWRRVVARDAAVLSRGLPQLPRLALGFFHQEDDAAGQRRRKKRSTTDSRPSFVPTTTPTTPRLLRRLALPDGGLLEHARPVMARNGWLVLELHRERHADGLKLCVCNPMSGAPLALLPPLAGADKPGDYACALLTGHDLDPPAPLSGFFRLLIVYNRRSFTALRAYSRDTDHWSAETQRLPGRQKITTHKLHALGQSVVLRGVAYWPLGRGVFGVRLDVEQPVEVPTPMPPGIQDLPLGQRSLGIAPDGKLIFIDVAVCCGYLSLVALVLCAKNGDNDGLSAASSGGDDGGLLAANSSGDDDGNMCWKIKQSIRLKDLKVPWFGPPANLRWFCEKSGVLFFTLGQRASSPGAFALNLATKEVQQVAGGPECDSWRNCVGYEMDGATYLQMMAFQD